MTDVPRSNGSLLSAALTASYNFVRLATARGLLSGESHVKETPRRKTTREDVKTGDAVSESSCWTYRRVGWTRGCWGGGQTKLNQGRLIGQKLLRRSQRPRSAFLASLKDESAVFQPFSQFLGHSGPKISQ